MWVAKCYSFSSRAFVSTLYNILKKQTVVNTVIDKVFSKQFRDSFWIAILKTLVVNNWSKELKNIKNMITCSSKILSFVHQKNVIMNTCSIQFCFIDLTRYTALRVTKQDFLLQQKKWYNISTDENKKRLFKMFSFS